MRLRPTNIISLLACLAFASFGLAQSLSLTVPDSDANADTPSGSMRLHIGGTAPVGYVQDPVPTEDEEEIPPAPTDEEEEGLPPTFFGESVQDRFVFVLDRSGSMLAVDGNYGPVEDHDGNIISNPNRLEIVKDQAIGALGALETEDEFAVVTFGGNVTYYQSRVPATDENIADAIAQIVSMKADGATPAYKALEVATRYYGNDLQQIFFLSDGAPNVGGGPTEILTIFPNWYAGLKANDCELICIQIGISEAAETFMKELALQNDGTYRSF